MIRSVFFLILLLQANLSNSQSPGFIGKRFTVGYGFYASPGLAGSQGITIFNKTHEGYLEFAAAKKFSIGLSARTYKAIYGNGRDMELISGYSSYGPEQIDKNPTGFYNIKGTNYMLYGKYFKSNYLAPWGKYFIFGITLNTFKTIYDPLIMSVGIKDTPYGSSYNYSYTYYTNFGELEQSYKKIDILIGNGRSRIISKNIVIDYGYNLNLIALLRTLDDATDANIREITLTPTDYIAVTSAARVRGVNRFNLFLKIGFIF